jgi:hypothetical protein
MNNTHDWNTIENKLSAYLKNDEARIQLQDTPYYPLSFHTEMPENVDFDNGHLSFRFKDFALSALHHISLDKNSCRQEGDALSIAVNLGQVMLNAKYEINAKYAAKINLDTAGNLQELDESYAKPAGASDDDTKPLSPDEIDSMIEQARDQKEPMSLTLHGPVLLSDYNVHNEAYNDAFVISESLRYLWAQDGVTTEMSRDTHKALNDNSVINPDSKKYVNGYDYNFNAGAQQLNVSFALDVLAKKALEEGNTILYDRYHNASLAALSFGETTKGTGDGKEPAQMTGSEVYATLNDPKAKKIEVTEAQYKNIMDQANDERSKDGGAAEEAVRNGWRVLDNEERRMIRERIFIFQKELMAIKDVVPVLLWTGDCHASLQGSQLTFKFTYNDLQSSWQLIHSEVKLPGFAIQVDDALWTGKAAEVARERLSNMHFVKSLLQGKIESGIQQILENALIQVLSN